jgi:imidazolonepropionase-like amidohydrolase
MKNDQLWTLFVNAYRNCGKVVAGSDTGYICRLYSFGYAQDLEILQEAGFHPLEVIRAATKIGTQVLGIDADIGTSYVDISYVGKRQT